MLHHDSQRALHVEPQTKLPTETHGKCQEAIQQTKETHEEVHTIKGVREEDSTEIATKTTENLPSQGTRTNSNERIEGTTQEETHSEPSKANIEANVPETSSPKENIPVIHQQADIQFSQNITLVRTQQNDSYDLLDYDYKDYDPYDEFIPLFDSRSIVVDGPSYFFYYHAMLFYLQPFIK